MRYEDELKQRETMELREMIRGIVDRAIADERERICRAIAMVAMNCEGPVKAALIDLSDRVRDAS